MSKPKRFCKIEGCGKPAHGQGYCANHYYRWKAHGDPLGGGTGMREAQRYFREVVMAYEGDECLPWPFSTNPQGYGQLHHDGKLTLVSRLVCEEVNGPPPSPAHHAAHSCGKGQLACCTKRHIDWKTKAGNEADKLLHGTHNRGERHGMAVLTEPEAREILALKGKVSPTDLARRHGVDPSTVRAIHARKNWAWMSDKPPELPATADA